MQAKVDAANAAQQAGGDAATTSGITARPTGLQPLYNLDGSVRPGAGAANAALSTGDGAANLASSAPKGAGLNADYLNKVINGQIPRPTVSPEQAQAALDWQSQNGGQLASAAKDAAAGAAKGYSQEYLQKVANGEIQRPMISVEKAKQLLGQMNESVKLTESQIFIMIGRIVERQRKLDEGVMDSIKGAAGKAMNWAQTKGTNLTTKITADKLLQAWKKAGSPVDSVEFGKFLTTQGIANPTITSAFAQLKLPDPFATAAPATAPATAPAKPAASAPATAPAKPAASAPATAPAAPASNSAIGQGIAQVKPGQPAVNPELQKRLAARKAGKPQYAANLEENRLRKRKNVIR
jgi:hypothetical protein